MDELAQGNCVAWDGVLGNPSVPRVGRRGGGGEGSGFLQPECLLREGLMAGADIVGRSPGAGACPPSALPGLYWRGCLLCL